MNGMPEMNGEVFTVKRPEDGAIVPLTCTREQFEQTWKPAGYELAEETPNPAIGGRGKPQDRKPEAD
jgi:hypothetical protein